MTASTLHPSTGIKPSVRWLGTIDYLSAWDEQRRTHAAVLDGSEPDTVLLLEHPSVYTAGKRTEAEDRPTDGSPVVDVDRGKTGGGRTPGARSRSPAACRSTSRTIRPCASAMKPSIKRCSFKVEARCAAN